MNTSNNKLPHQYKFMAISDKHVIVKQDKDFNAMKECVTKKLIFKK